ncbi:hypothetical protein L484_015936 [Morus notabilis]|uniref:Uncharacterized protein n=1 Tax=Morus notabilis TaxID=981085 RepID=W9QNG2_9ROSA|nr:hypothetical protein L484_015936 [Morus notabilis]
MMEHAIVQNHAKGDIKITNQTSIEANKENAVSLHQSPNESEHCQPKPRENQSKATDKTAEVLNSQTMAIHFTDSSL